MASVGSGTDVAMPSASVMSWAQRSSARRPAGQADLGRLADARLDGGGEFLDGAGHPIQGGPRHVGRSVMAGQAHDRAPQIVAPERAALPVEIGQENERRVARPGQGLP